MNHGWGRVALMMQAHRHSYADVVHRSVMGCEVLPNRTGDYRQQRIVDGRAGHLARRPFHLPERKGGHTDRTLGADVAVERRRTVRAGEFALAEAGQVAPPARIVVVLSRHLHLRRLLPRIPEQRPGEAHDRGAVGERVMQPPDERTAAGVERDDVHVPERAIPGQVAGELRGDVTPQPVRIEGCGELDVDDVTLEVEVRVDHPGRCGRRAAETAGEQGCRGDPAGDELPELGRPQAIGRQLDHLARVPDDRRTLEVEDRAVLFAQQDGHVRHVLLGLHRRHLRTDSPAATPPALRISRTRGSGGQRRRVTTPTASPTWGEPQVTKASLIRLGLTHGSGSRRAPGGRGASAEHRRAAAPAAPDPA